MTFSMKKAILLIEDTWASTEVLELEALLKILDINQKSLVPEFW